MIPFDPVALYVVSGHALLVTAIGYVHKGGYFAAQVDDASTFDLAGAIKAASLAMRADFIDATSVKIVPMVDSLPDHDAAISAAVLLADLERKELAQALGEIDASDPVTVFATLDEVQIRSMLRDGVRITGVQAATRPKHETNGLI